METGEGLAVRLHRIRFKHAPMSLRGNGARADFVRDLMIMYGCYLQREDAFGYEWRAHYE